MPRVSPAVRVGASGATTGRQLLAPARPAGHTAGASRPAGRRFAGPILRRAPSMAALARAVVAVCLAAAIGCDGSKPPQSPEQLKGRLDAATGITDPGARNAALQPV